MCRWSMADWCHGCDRSYCPSTARERRGGLSCRRPRSAEDKAGARSRKQRAAVITRGRGISTSKPEMGGPYWSDTQLHKMDAQFHTRMMAETASGSERCATSFSTAPGTRFPKRLEHSQLLVPKPAHTSAENSRQQSRRGLLWRAGA